MTNDTVTEDSTNESRPDETPIDWLARIAPNKWETTEDGYQLILQSGNRRITVDTLESQALFEERIETEKVGERWIEHEIIEDDWYIQTTAGLLLWGISGPSPEQNIETPNTEQQKDRE